jgi:hypothetical protein
MNNLLAMLKRTSLVVGLMIVGVLAYTPAGAGEDGLTTSMGGGNGLYIHGNLNSIPSEGVSLFGSTGLTIPVVRSLALDLNLSSVDTGRAITDSKPSGVPPIPTLKPGEVGLRSCRLGLGFSFRF